MALKLDIRNDTIVPSKAFQEWAEKVLTDEGIKTSGKNFFTKLEARSKDLQKRLADLKQKIDACPAGSDVWFSRMFLWPFGGKVTADAKEYFDELEKDGKIKELETAADTAAAARQTNGTKLDAACVFALNLLENPNEGLPAAVGALSLALSSTPTAAPAGAAPALAGAPAKGIKEALFAAFTADPVSARLIYPTAKLENIPNQLLRSIKTVLMASINGNKGKRGIQLAPNPERKAAAEKLLAAAGISDLQTLTESYSLDDSTLAPVAESRMFSSLDILLESGRITQEDYNRTSKRLLRTSAIINEAAPATPTPPTEAEKTTAIAANKAKFGGFVSSIAENCKTLDTALKSLQTLGKNLAKQPVAESLQTQVFKAHIKKRILQETAGKDSREQLNEFFLIAALLAALTGAIAWAAAKIGDFFKGSEYSRSSPTYSSPSTPEQIAKAAADLGSSLTAAWGPDGMLVDASGRRVIGEIQVKTAFIKALDSCVNAIRLSMVLFETIEQEAGGAAAAAAQPAAAAAAQPAAAAAAQGAALAAYLGVAEPEKIKAAEKALVMLDKYKNADTIGKAVEAVIAALKAV